MHVFETRDSEVLRFAVRVFEMNNTTNGSLCHLQPSTCDIHSKVYYSKNIPWGTTECSQSSQESRWFPALPERSRDSLAFNQVKMSDRQGIAGVDLSQSLNRAPATNVFISGKKPVVVAPTILPNSLIWLMLPPKDVDDNDDDDDASHPSLPEERPLTGVEQMLLQGWPVHAGLVDMDRHHGVLRDLSGNMFTGTVFLSVMMALLFSVEWDKLAKEEDSEIMDEGVVSEAVSNAVKRRRT